MTHTKLNGALGGVLVLLLGISLSVGDMPFSLLYTDPQLGWAVLETTRLPRTLLATLTGGCLGLTGATLQGFFRNPLADAGVIGIASAASFGSVLAITLGVSTLFVPLWGLLGAALLLALLYYVLSKHPCMLTLILMGLGFNSLLMALTSLTLNLSDNPYKNLEIMFWLMGSFSHQTLDAIFWSIPFLSMGFFILWRYRLALNALSLGEDMAISLGYSMKKLISMIIIGTALCVGPLTALGGSIGFVGLIVPHLIRPYVAHKPSVLVLPSALGGSVLCLMADILIRCLPTQTELKIGVITALLGAPFFLYFAFTHKEKSHDSY